MTRPFSSCCFMRTASVFTPRSTSQHSNGDMMAPADFCMNASFSACSFCRADHHAAQSVAVAVQELRRRVHHHVRAQA